MTRNCKKRNPASIVMYSSRPWRSRLLRIHLCNFSMGVALLLLYFDSSSAQGNLNRASFVFTSSVESDSIFNGTTITCLGSAKLSNGNLSEDHRTGPMHLTPSDLPSKTTTGRCLYQNAIQFSNGFGFSTTFSFTTVGFPNFAQGQGFTFFIGPNNTYQGQSGLYLGWLDDTTANNASGNNFAVEFDIFQNSQVNDSDNNHVGINVNSLKSTYSVSLWPYKIPLTSYWTNSLLYVWIDYDGINKMIDVRLSTTNKFPCSSIIYENLNLSSVLSLENMYVGFSAATGDDSTNSQTTIYDWSFSSIGPYRSQADNIYSSDAFCGEPRRVPWIWILAAAIGALTVCMALAVFSLQRRTRTIIDLERALLEIQNLDCGPHEFTYKELSRATNSFSDKLMIGAGGFGNVYKGTLSKDSSNNFVHDSNEKDSLTAKSSRIVAVKKMKDTSLASAKDYVAEVKVIGRMRHINLVRLLGWCHERNELLLVYDYMPNGNLQELLTKKQDEGHGGELSWEKRKTILRGVAAALLYLHEDFEQRVVHRDVKSSNVLLDKEFHARLGDFGLARAYDRSQDHCKSTVVAGTIGYIAPESVVTGVATCKSDVYSFGAVVLEVATGRNPKYGGEGLAKWVWRLKEEGKVLEAADEQLAGKFSGEEMEKILTLGIFCSLPDPDVRPTMRQALSVLQEGESQISSWSKLPALAKSGLSLQNFDSDYTDSTMSTTDWGSQYTDSPQFPGKDYISR